MGLVKANKASAPAPAPEPGSSLSELQERLADPDAAVRRFAARAMGSVAGAANLLCDRLEAEADVTVRAAIMGSLRQHRGPELCRRLMNLLHSEDAGLRNDAIELLGEWPDEVARRIDALLADPDSDVRIFAVNILGVMPHPAVPGWLLRVLRDDDHVNVCCAAVDVLTEVGDADAVAPLEAVKLRFPDEPFLHFAVNIALRRIGVQ